MNNNELTTDPAHLVFGPQGEEVAAIITQIRHLTDDEVNAFYVTWNASPDAAQDAARDAVWCVAQEVRGTAWDAARDAAWEAMRDSARKAMGDTARDEAWDATWDAAGCALLATLTRDIITPEQYEALARPWLSWTEGAGLRLSSSNI